jgi:acetamidase/formamidase
MRSAGWITLGLHEDLQEAIYLAIEAMLDLMQAQYGLPRPDALALANLTADLRITQIVVASAESTQRDHHRTALMTETTFAKDQYEITGRRP